MSKECQHGQLARSCSVCEDKERIAELERENREHLNRAAEVADQRNQTFAVLRHEIAVRDGDLARLKGELARANHNHAAAEAELKAVAEGYAKELAAAQATIEKKDEALDKIADPYSAYGPFPENNPQWRAMAVVTAREALALPNDRTALDEMLAEARREQVEKDAGICKNEANRYCAIVEGPFATEYGKQIHQAIAAGATNCANAIRQSAGGE